MRARFTTPLWTAAGDVYEAIVALPFNRELAAGTLDPALVREAAGRAR